MADKPWYQQTTDELFANLDTQEQGLTEATVKERREKYGENKLEFSADEIATIEQILAKQPMIDWSREK